MDINQYHIIYQYLTYTIQKIVVSKILFFPEKIIIKISKDAFSCSEMMVKTLIMLQKVYFK